MSSSVLRKIFTIILAIYLVNLIARLIMMDKQYLDGTLATSASTEAVIIFLLYIGLIALVGVVTLIVSWPFKWLRLLLLIIILALISLFLCLSNGLKLCLYFLTN